MASARPSSRHSRFRRVAGIALIVAGGLWTMLWALVWYAIWVLAGPAGVAMAAFDWRFLGPVALGIASVAVGVWLRAEEPRAAIVIGWTAAVLTALAGVERMVAIQDEGPYPFADVAKGGLIAYSATDGIRLVRSDGGRSWLVPGAHEMGSPVWSPDGTRLAAGDFDETFGTYSFRPNGSGQKRLPFDVETTPVWSPDGQRMAVVGDDIRIRVVRLADGVVETVLPLDGNEPAWSADGTWIAFQTSVGSGLLQVYVVRSDGTGLRRLTDDRAPAGVNRVGATTPSWSPDGTLAYASDRDGDEEIYVTRPDGSGARKVTRNPADDSSPSWSPDGRRIVFDRTDYERQRRAIVVVDLTTRKEIELAHSDEDFVSEPAWQPTGAGVHSPNVSFRTRPSVTSTIDSDRGADPQTLLL